MYQGQRAAICKFTCLIFTFKGYDTVKMFHLLLVMLISGVLCSQISAEIFTCCFAPSSIYRVLQESKNLKSLLSGRALLNPGVRPVLTINLAGVEGWDGEGEGKRNNLLRGVNQLQIKQETFEWNKSKSNTFRWDVESNLSGFGIKNLQKENQPLLFSVFLYFQG